MALNHAHNIGAPARWPVDQESYTPAPLDESSPTQRAATYTKCNHTGTIYAHRGDILPQLLI
jgi:hypothetical protein